MQRDQTENHHSSPLPKEDRYQERGLGKTKSTSLRPNGNDMLPPVRLEETVGAELNASLREFSLPPEDLFPHSGALDDAKKKEKKKKKKSENNGYRAIEESLTGRVISWSRDDDATDVIKEPQGLPFSQDLEYAPKRGRRRSSRNSNENGKGKTPIQEIVVNESCAFDTSDDASKDETQSKIPITLDLDGFPLNNSSRSLELMDLKTKGQEFDKKSITLEQLHEPLPFIEKIPSKQIHHESFTTSTDKSPVQNGHDARLALNTASAFEAILRSQPDVEIIERSISDDNSWSLDHVEDDKGGSIGDWDDPFAHSKFWGSMSTLGFGDNEDVKSFQEHITHDDSWASFGRIRRNEAFVKRVSSKDLVTQSSTRSNLALSSCAGVESLDRSRTSKDGKSSRAYLPQLDKNGSRLSVRSLDQALVGGERTLEQQLACLSLSQRMCVSALRRKWEEHAEGDHFFPDAWYLRFARCSPGAPFNYKSAWRVMKRFDWRYLDLSISNMETIILTKTAFPVPGLKTKGGRHVFYMRPGRYFPRKTPTDTTLDLLVYTMNCMLESEHCSVHGIGLVANMTGWKMENFSVPYWHKLLMTIQGYRVPTRLSLFLIVNPPDWFPLIWEVMKPMMSQSFRKKVAVIGLDELDMYLMDGCLRHLPDDMEGGKLNTDTLVKAFISERKASERKLA